MSDRLPMGEVYIELRLSRLPPRACVAVAELPFGARIELNAVAYREHL